MAKRNFKGKGKGRNSKRANDDQQNGWAEIVKENSKWEDFYKAQNLMSEEDFNSFKSFCQNPLPLTFRITGSRKHAGEILEIFKSRHLKYLTDLKYEGESIPPPKPLAFYPNELAWQIEVSKQVIRKKEEFSKTQRFLVVETEVGNISRQEAVSMIPPILMDVKSHHKVLDMCAAPGSKTAQLIEALHGDTESPTGFVIANDSDFKRAHMLVHQIKRLNSPNMIVVNHDAQFFPKTYLHGKIVKFDRILCDVPCSGDGTIRKNIQIWKKWSIGDGLGLNPLQYKILQRGLDLLAKGGRLVYSTCSMNPMENEAVILQALRKNKDVRVVKQQIDGLVHAPGLNDWKVYGKDFEVKEKGQDPAYGDELFPPTEEERDQFNLQYGIRVYPHQQNTGAFFITVLEKIDDTPVQEEQEEEQPKKKFKKDDTITSTTNTVSKKEKLSSNANDGNEPFNFLEKNHEELSKCWKFYGIEESHNEITECCFVRNATGDPSRMIYLSNPLVKDFLIDNEKKLKIVHSGVKIFVSQRTDLECKWRIQSESLPIIKSKLSDARVLEGCLSLFEKLLKEAFPRFEELAEIDSKFVERVKTMTQGCAFIKISRDDESLEELIFPFWIGSKCINLMLSKKETFEVLYRVFNVETNASLEYKQGPSVDSSGSKIEDVNSAEPEETGKEETKEE